MPPSKQLEATPFLDTAAPEYGSGPVALEDGALVSGGSLSLASREAVALFSQYFAIGILYGMLPGLKYPVFNNYLHMEGYQTSAYGVLIYIGWSFKVFLGMLSDCFPIFGYRRKPYMLLGWAIATLALSILTFSPFPAPYCDARHISCLAVTPPVANLTRDGTLQYYNMDAPNGGTKFIVLSVLVGFGYVMADCAADAMVVQYAQREPMETRGRTQTAIYTSRYLGQMLAQFSIAFLLNGKEYGGSFDFSVTPNVMYGICLVPCVLIVPSTLFVLREVKTERMSFRAWVHRFWDLLQTRVMWQICAFKFINSAFSSFAATPSAPIARTWAGVEPLNDAISGVLGSLLMSLIMAVVGKWGLNWNWRMVIASTTVGIIAIDATAVFATVWNVYRNQWFYNGVVLAEKIPDGIRFMVASYCAVEIADVGNEGATYGLVTTVGNLATPFASVFYKLADSAFDVAQTDISRDDSRVRWQVTYCFLLSYAVKAAALGWLFLLPPQKEALQRMKRDGARSKLAGGVVVSVFFLALAFSVTTNFIAIALREAKEQSTELGQMDLLERVSYIQSATNDKHGEYIENKSPDELEDGALVAGGALPLLSREALALFSQYFAIGIIYGMLPGIQYPVFQNYLHMEGYQVSAYGVLVTLGWSFKVFFGMLSDCVPIMGYRRKPWMILGWTIATICLAIMTFTPFADPYCDGRKITCPKKLPKYDTMNKTWQDAVNLDAPDSGSKFIFLSVVVGFGYVMADCAADAMVVQYAQREPIAIRGRTQTAIYTMRYIGQMLATVVIAFALNGKEYGGSFDYSTSVNVIYGILLVPCALIMLSTIFLLVEVKTERTPFSAWVSMFWGLLQKRVMWQICAFKFVYQVFAGISATPGSPMASVWADVEPINDALSGVLSYLIMSLVIAAVGKWGLHWNWRYVIAISTIAIIIIDGSVNFITIWNVFRNQWFFTGVPLADNVPGGIRFIVATYCAVEIADLGNEGATYGLVTTVSNLAGPFASVLYKYIDSFFDVSMDQMAVDDEHVRWEVSYTFFISYACKIAALGWLFMLPPQKEAMQELKKRGGSSKLAGGALVLVFFGALTFSVVTNFMSIYPSTKCYRIAGGKGTTNGSCLIKK
ncbi:Folate-Biopterin Transporter (FBT) Family [Achlya hypogyna]|uniref:Folate-Biopterin Transporter (FBT) Family n=1 Tax=Achlya hypogyna TaxID=1202772 RepID=A0A1V9Z591_ACHHY|nr:Folate-Biopterin Transporter (FBT) Family [Achlya hypogyna]